MAEPLEQAVQRMRDTLLNTSRETGATPCILLAELVKSVLLSDDDDPCHVYGIDFIRGCECALRGETSGNPCSEQG